MKTAGAYIRVSTDEQTDYSPDAQLRDIKDYCKKKDILLLDDHIYVDEGISGTKADKRPAFQTMIATAKIKTKPFDVILVHKFDRFARNREDSIVYKSLLRKRLKIDVISIKEDVGTDKNGFLLEGMLDVLSEYYSLNLSDEVKKGQLEKVRQGGNVSKLPFGYKIDGNGGILVVEEEAKIIKVIFEKFSNGKGRRLIGKELFNDLGVKNQNGNPLSQERIDYILNNPIYAGFVRRSTNGQFKKKFKDTKIMIEKGVHEAIVDENTWKKTQEILKIKKDNYSQSNKNWNNKHWLSGILRCENCNSVMIRYKSRNCFLWQCSAYTHGRDLTSNSIMNDRLEKTIIDQLKKDFTSNVEITITNSTTPKDNLELDILYNQLEKNKYQLERITTAYQNGIDTLQEYKENKIRLQHKKKETQSKLDKLNIVDSKEMADVLKKLSKKVYTTLINEKVSDEEKYNLSHLLFDKITYNKQTETICIYYKNILL